MNLSPHFSLAEFTASTKAMELGIDNTLPDELQVTAIATAEMMEGIRAHLSKIAGRDVPIKITSAYRCAALNAAVGGKANSDHVRGKAVDWCAPSFGTPYEICRELAPQISALEIGQLIHEFGTWVHASTRAPERPVNRVITISAAGTVLGIQRV